MAPTVLIVDDHPSFRTTARFLLEAEGFVVVGEAEDGHAALAAAADLTPDLVLLDVGLPDMDGFEVCSQLTQAANGTAPVVVMTSSRDGCEYRRCLAESGARGFVPKDELSGAALSAFLR